MRMRSLLSAGLVSVFLLACPLLSYSKDLAPVQLPNPQMEGGKPLMQVLKERASTRTFSDEKLSVQVLSNLLWAAFGINRPDSDRRTAPSARNRQEIDIYVATADGLYRYDAKKNLLDTILGEDIRAATGTQPYVKEASINLVYVADYSRTQAASDEREFLAAADVGFIAENVYLFCASEGLGTVIRAAIDKGELAKAMKLKPEQKIILAQSVGYPKK